LYLRDDSSFNRSRGGRQKENSRKFQGTVPVPLPSLPWRIY